MRTATNAGGVHKRHPADKDVDDGLKGSLIPIHTLDSRSEGGWGGNQHRVPVALLSLAFILCSTERMAMSVAVLPLSLQYGWTDTVKGAVSSSFQVGHIVSNLSGGVLAAVLPPVSIMAGGIMLWSIFVLLTPLSASTLPLLLIVRAVMGLGEGVMTPCMQVIVKGCVPSDSRGQSLSLIYSGHSIGSILSLILTPVLINSCDVPAAFMLYGAVGMILLYVWQTKMGARTGGSWHKRAADPSTQQVVEPGASPAGVAVNGLQRIPWVAMLSNRTFWALLVAHSTFGICVNVVVAWLPTYYAQEFKLNVQVSSFLSILPWLVMATASNVSGWLADYLIKRKILKTTQTRKLLQMVGNLGPGLCLFYLALGPKSSASVVEATILMTICMATMGFQAGAFAAVHTDISTKYASVLFGVTNAASSLAGGIFVYLVGVVLDRLGSWSLIFNIVSAANFIAAAVFLALVSSDPQFD